MMLIFEQILITTVSISDIADVAIYSLIVYTYHFVSYHNFVRLQWMPVRYLGNNLNRIIRQITIIMIISEIWLFYILHL